MKFFQHDVSGSELLMVNKPRLQGLSSYTVIWGINWRFSQPQCSLAPHWVRHPTGIPCFLKVRISPPCFLERPALFSTVTDVFFFFCQKQSGLTRREAGETCAEPERVCPSRTEPPLPRDCLNSQTRILARSLLHVNPVTSYLLVSSEKYEQQIFEWGQYLYYKKFI